MLKASYLLLLAAEIQSESFMAYHHVAESGYSA